MSSASRSVAAEGSAAVSDGAGAGAGAGGSTGSCGCGSSSSDSVSSKFIVVVSRRWRDALVTSTGRLASAGEAHSSRLSVPSGAANRFSYDSAGPRCENGSVTASGTFCPQQRLKASTTKTEGLLVCHMPLAKFWVFAAFDALPRANDRVTAFVLFL